MNQEFRRCLDSGKIVPFPRGKELAGKEIIVARSDLADARAGFDNERYKWSTIQAYYSIFHAARALVYSRGYREKSHYCLAVALRALYVEESLLEIQFVRDFMNAMSLREAADYESSFSMDGAKAVIASAGRFLEKAAAILCTDE
ncbi:MAG: HEPN domain-containing protein [Dehalococcoidia bacterium]|nr:HEPN domain-containing protein [Dehalococcoidia bacterium]